MKVGYHLTERKYRCIDLASPKSNTDLNRAEIVHICKFGMLRSQKETLDDDDCKNDGGGSDDDDDDHDDVGEDAI